MSDTAHEQRKLAAIMFTDMVGYSALAQRNEARAIELLEEHRKVVRGVLPRHQGREVKTTGDGFLIEFPSALAAVSAAVDIQKAMHERNEAVPDERKVNIRVGIHVGDVVMREGDIHGDGVNIAARLEPLAAPGGICISSAVWELVRNKMDYPLALLGPAELKNIELPVVVHRVVMPWESATQPALPSRPRHSGKAPALGIVALLALLGIAAYWWLNRLAQPQAAIPHVSQSPVVTPTNKPADKPVEKPAETNTILFKTGFDFPGCRQGRLPGQDGWFARGGFSSGAAKVIAEGSGQLVLIKGSDIEHVNTNMWSAWYFQRIPTNVPDVNAARISVAADFQFLPGSAAEETGYVTAMLMLSDARATPYAAVGLAKNGSAIGQNFTHPTQNVHAKPNTNHVHRMKAYYDFATRTATMIVDGERLGSLPFNPKVTNAFETVGFSLQADHPVDSILRVDNLIVRSEPKVQDAKSAPPLSSGVSDQH